MARNKKLAKLIRERMKRTGETYSTARMHILASYRGKGRDEPRATSAWVPDETPQLPKGTLTRLLRVVANGPAEVRPLIVAPMGWRWKILFLGRHDSALQRRFAAPSAEIACAYADDYLHSAGFVGPGIQPLPSQYPPLRLRTNEMIPMRSPSPIDAGALVEAARCGCGHVGEDIVDRSRRCPSCGGYGILFAETLSQPTPSR
jgi:hypothetical protein